MWEQQGKTANTIYNHHGRKYSEESQSQKKENIQKKEIPQLSITWNLHCSGVPKRTVYFLISFP